MAKKKQAARGNGNKTTLTDASVDEYFANIADEGRRADCQALAKLMTSVTRKPPKMWGPSIVGFGQYHYKYDSGREGDMCLAGFSSRASALTIYVLTKGREELLASLGKYKGSTGCMYIKRLSDVDTTVLRKLIAASVAEIKRQYP